jgi:hypothetical protein
MPGYSSNSIRGAFCESVFAEASYSNISGGYHGKKNYSYVYRGIGEHVGDVSRAVFLCSDLLL